MPPRASAVCARASVAAAAASTVIKVRELLIGDLHPPFLVAPLAKRASTSRISL